MLRKFLVLSLAVFSASAFSQSAPNRNRLVGTSGSGITQEKLEQDERLVQCMSAFGKETMCRCLSIRIPRGVSFEQYFVILTRPKTENGYDKLDRAGKAIFDSLPAIRDVCAAV